HTHTHTQLRRCLAFLLFIIIPYNSFAIDACAPNDTVAIVLDASRKGGSYDNSWSSSKVTVYMPFGTIYGVAACLDSDYGVQGDNSVYTDNNGVLMYNGNVVVGGENNGYYCWCRITYPIMSNWIFIAGPTWYLESSHSPCAWRCSADCGYHLGNNYRNRLAYLLNLVQN
ncbi:MAG: hypothetical protein IJL05_04335, partial [Alphaproteobacteria bacterium]|nr:hypothetical protein [Alphaproteobacteria bacterium]